MAIVGSRATMLYYNDLRIAGAQVRKVLMQNAAEKWGVDAASLSTEPGFVVNPANGQKLSYGEIAAFGKGALAASRGRSQGAESPEGLAADRQGRGAARHAVQGQRHGAYTAST